MYVPAAFKIHHAVGLAFAEQRGFGLVVAHDGGRPLASLVPFLLVQKDGQPPRAEFHVARTNPLGELAAKGGWWLLAVQGHDAYVSADWYASAEQVPTWLYETVHLSGRVSVLEGARKVSHLAGLSEKFESWLAPKPAWTLDALTAGRREALTNAITVIELVIDSVEGSFKLNQHKGDADHVAVANALARQESPAAQAMAARMIALRPQLAYT